MIHLRCPQCDTTLPVAENKIGTRVFVCPECAHPLDAPAPAAPAAESPPAEVPKPAPAPLAASEGKTMVPDASLQHVQQKLREAKARRSSPDISPTPAPAAPTAPPAPKKKPAAPASIEKPGLPRGLLWGGAITAAMLVVGTLAFVLASRDAKPRPGPDTPAPEPVVQAPPDIVPPTPSTAPALAAPTTRKTPDTKPAGPRPPSVAALTQTLKKGSPPERKKALRDLAIQGPKAHAALAAVVDMLKDPDPDLRTQARETLGKLGPVVPADLPVFSDALRDPSPELRTYAAEQLAGLGQQARGELVFLRVLVLDENTEIQEAARKAVSRIEESLLAGLVKELQDKSPAVRGKAAAQLAEMGANAKPALPSLVDALADNNSAVRLAVLDAFVAIGPDAILVLGEALRDRNPQVRLTAINALGRMGPDARFVLPELIACLWLDARTKDETLQALARIGDYVIPSLVKALEREKEPGKQKPLIEALEHLGPSAGPALQAALKNAKPEVTKVTAELVAKVKSQSPLPPVKEHTGTTGMIQSQLRGWFKAADTNKDDFLDKDELAVALRGKGAKAYDFTPPGQQPRTFTARDFPKYPDYSLLCRLDRDDDGKISRDEFERWAYDYADFLKKDLDERVRIAQAQDRLMERNLSEAMRMQRQAAVAGLWNNYHAARHLQGAVNREIANMEWMQRWTLTHLPRR